MEIPRCHALPGVFCPVWQAAREIPRLSLTTTLKAQSKMLEACACNRRVSLLNSRRTSGNKELEYNLEAPPMPASSAPNRRRRIFLLGISLKQKISIRVKLPHSQFSAQVCCCPLCSSLPVAFSSAKRCSAVMEVKAVTAAAPALACSWVHN